MQREMQGGGGEKQGNNKNMTNAAIDSTIQMHAARTNSNLLGFSKTQKTFCLFSDSSKSTTRITKDFKNRICKKRKEEADMPVAGSSADAAKLHQSEAHSPPEQQSCPLERKRNPHCHHL
jgi:hypothetical protein